MIENVLDASAVLVYLYSETGADKVETLLENSTISRINATEVLTKIVQDGLPLMKPKKPLES